MTNDLLERVPELKKAFGGGSGQVTTPELQNLQPPKRQEGQGSGIPVGMRQHRNDFERGEEAQDPPKLLQGAVVAEVRHVRSQVVHRSAGKEALEFVQRLQPRLHVVETRGIQLQHRGSLDERTRLLLHELHQLHQVPISGHNRHSPPMRLPLTNFTPELGFSERSQQRSPTPWKNNTKQKTKGTNREIRTRIKRRRIVRTRIWKRLSKFRR